MLLRRLGNKKKLAKKIIPYFPKHKIFVDLFLGSGGIYFYKPLAKYNFLNDLDNDVFNLFMVLKEKPGELTTAIQNMPIHNSLFQYWRHNEERTDIWKAVRFLMLSNFGYMGMPDTMRVGNIPSKKTLLGNIQKTYDFIIKEDFATTFLNCDFRDALKKIAFIQDCRNDEAKTFIYADPPYQLTTDNYSHSFTETDFADLLNVLTESKIKFACSEFDNPFVIEQAKQRGLNIHIIGERQSLKKRRTEILITNYEANQQELF